MATGTTPVVIDRGELIELRDELRRETADAKRRAELDARVLGRLHTFYGHRRSNAVSTVLPAAFRRTRDLFRGL